MDHLTICFRRPPLLFLRDHGPSHNFFKVKARVESLKLGLGQIPQGSLRETCATFNVFNDESVLEN